MSLRASLALMLVAGACSGREARSAANETGVAAHGFPAPPSAPYEVIEVHHGGLITGSVRIAASVPRDTVVRPMTDQAVCGTGHVERTMLLDDGRLGGAIVWLHDIRTGKRLPMERLFEVLHDDCRIVPRVQAVVTGGTMNVRSADPVAHRTRFVHLHTDEPLAVVRQTDGGSVVPVEAIVSRAGLVQVRCDVHPWTTGWIAVFDHPYFAETDRAGRFALAEVPPGRYRLVVWHERVGSIDAVVEVATGRETNVELVYTKVGAPQTPASKAAVASRGVAAVPRP